MKDKIKKIILSIVSLSFIFSCSFDRAPKDLFSNDSEEGSLIGKIEPIWFSGAETMSLKDSNGFPVPHLLFDISTEILDEVQYVKYIVETPVASPVMYSLDPVTGRHFAKKAYCSQNDIWKDSQSSINKPPFTTAIVPRFIDQLGSSQKMIVFGAKNESYSDFMNQYYEARVIGAFIEQTCPEGQCSKVGTWLSRIVLVGIDSRNISMKDVKTIEELKNRVDWRAVKAFVENGQGTNLFALDFYPAFRMGTTISREKAINYTQDYSVYLTNKKLLSMRKSCLKLYEYFYQEVMRDSKFEASLRESRTLKKKQNVLAKAEPKKKDLFYHRFTTNIRKYGTQLNICLDYMYSSNINDNPVRHWDFAYLEAILNLYKLGYGFDCSRNIWVDLYGKKEAIKSAFRGCLVSNIDNAFQSAPIKLKQLFQKGYSSYVYIDYDSGPIGTHQKIYSWVYMDNKHLQCEDVASPSYRKNRTVFPKDVQWRKREIKFNNKASLIK